MFDISWDATPVPNGGLDDLDHDLVQWVMRENAKYRRMRPEALYDEAPAFLDKFYLTKDGVPNCAAYALFGKKIPADGSVNSVLTFSRFRGTTRKDPMETKRFEANIFGLIKNANSLVDKLLESKTLHSLPKSVIQEALMNAFCHRDYTIPAGEVNIALFNNRLEITSDGNLPRGMALADLKQRHISFPRNLLIADVLFSCALIQAFGSGTERMIILCKEHDTPEPVFSLRGPDIFVTTFMLRKVIVPRNSRSSALRKKGYERMGEIKNIGVKPRIFLRKV